jgi:hypothetical protein
MQPSSEVLILQELGEIKATMASTAATLDALNQRLFDGPASVITTVQADIAEINKDRKDDAKWDRIHNIAHYSLPPVMVVIHAILRKFGVEI